MGTTELRTSALAKLVERGIDPSRILTPEQLEQLRVTFDELDGDDDGSVSLVELKQAMVQDDTPEHLDEQQFEQMFCDIDIDGDGNVSSDEFVMASAHRRLKVLEERAWNTFAGFDSDADGFVVRGELARLVDAGASPEDVARVFEDADGDGDERIDYEEFLAWYTDQR